MEEHEDLYTFIFDDPNTGRGPASRVVPRDKLKESLSKAYEWQQKDTLRLITVYGPGVAQAALTPQLQEYILTYVLHEREGPESGIRVAGLVWISRGGDGAYGLHKIVQRTHVYANVSCEVAPTIRHELNEVEQDKWKEALEWAHTRGWNDYGIWYRGYPGLVFAGDSLLAFSYLEKVYEISRYQDHVIRAPVRYSKTQVQGPCPLIRTTRKAGEIRHLRSEWPTAQEDLSHVPRDVLIQKYGYPKSKLNAAAWA